MNTWPEQFDEQQRKLDLLVDGELTDAERRQLLAALEQEPDGWRRCALAFLEGQSWQDDLGAFVRGPSSVVSGRASTDGNGERTTASGRTWWRHPSVGTLLAMAASVLVCFGLGLGTGRWYDGGRPSHRSASRGPDTLAGAASSHRPPSPGAAEQLTLVLAQDGNNVVPVQVPIIKDSAAAGWFQSAPQMPPELRQALEQLGSRVREHRQLIPVRMGDGREVVVPLERIDLQPVNLKDYQ